MRIYKLDGSYSENLTDTLFGWYLSDIIIDEAVPTFAEHNRKMRANSQLTLCKYKKCYSKDIIRIEFCNSIDPNRSYWTDSNSTYNNGSCSNSEENQTDISDDARFIDRLEPQIKIQPILNTVNCIMAVEGPKKDKKPLLQSIASIEWSMKDNLTNLIKPTCTIESKMLLCVISEARYRYLSCNYINLLKSIFSNSFINDELITEIQNYSRGGINQNMLSLMLQLILANNNIDIDELVSIIQLAANIKECNNCSTLNKEINNNFIRTQNLLSVDGNCTKSNSNLDEKCDENEFKGLGLMNEFGSIQNFSHNAVEFQLQLNEIKDYFKKELIKVESLIRETKEIQFQLEEMLYLDDILNLLNGNLKVTFLKLPFKILHSHQNDIDDNNIKNFIV